MANDDTDDTKTSDSTPPEGASSSKAAEGVPSKGKSDDERLARQPDPDDSEHSPVPDTDVDSEESEALAEKQLDQNPLPPGNGPDRPGIAPEAVRVTDEHGQDHGLAHTTPVSLLVAIFGTLIVLTFITVAVTAVDLGGGGNVIIAMVIATIKAALVIAYFMHLRWDKPFNRLAFLAAVLFLALFLSISLMDRSEYQHSIDELKAARGAQQ